MITHKIKVWTTAGALIATGCASATAQPAHQMDHGAKPMVQAAPEAEGEMGGAVKSEADFLQLLGLVEGHMTVGVELYAAGDQAQAKTHMKHPRDELYKSLKPELTKRNLPGFDAELDAVATAVESGKPVAEVLAGMDRLRAAIDKNGTPKTARTRLETISKLLRTAASEYAQGVKDGKVVNTHEYQDAYGFTQVAQRLLTNAPASESSKYTKQFTATKTFLEELKPAWPDVVGKMPVSTDSTLLAVAAARIEIEALSIK